MKKFIVAESLKWLHNCKHVKNVLTGICDMDETDFTMTEYLIFFKKIASLIFKKLDKKGYAIFIQTDRKYNLEWIDKSAILTELAYKHGLKMVWHKIILNRDVGKIDIYRPTYSHMLCYTYEGTSGKAFPDVINISERSYKNATPIAAAELAVIFIKKYYPHEIVDPFVGRGTIVALAHKHGLPSVGIDIDPEQIKIAEGHIL